MSKKQAKKNTAPTSAKKAVASKPKQEAPTPSAPTPPPAEATVLPPPPPPPVTAPEPTPPETIELEREGTSGKRYVSKTAPDSKYHLRNRSTTVKPCHVVRAHCAADPTAPRKVILERCMADGVDKNTAATQYSLWKAKNKAPLAHVVTATSSDTDTGEVVFVDEDEA